MRIFSKSIWFVFIVGRQRSHDAKSNFLFPFIASLSKPRDNRAAFFVRSFAAIPIYKIKAPEKIRGFGQNILFIMVVSKGLEPSTSCMWSMRSNQLSYETILYNYPNRTLSVYHFFSFLSIFLRKKFSSFSKIPVQLPEHPFFQRKFLVKAHKITCFIPKNVLYY